MNEHGDWVVNHPVLFVDRNRGGPRSRGQMKADDNSIIYKNLARFKCHTRSSILRGGFSFHFDCNRDDLH